MQLELIKQIKDHKPLRESFDELAVKVFDLSFEEWRKNGYWTERYIPYVFIENGRVVANASANRMELTWKGERRSYIQIGTVMTEPKYRNRGLQRRLIGEIIADWKDRCDGIYLFANETALNFYPKLDFVPAKEYQYRIPITARKSDFVKLDMDRKEHRETLKRCYEKSNPWSAFSMEENFELLMFCCGWGMKDCVYYSASLDNICIAREQEGELVCLDIFGEPKGSVEEVISSAASSKAKTAVLGFTPKNAAGYSCEQADSGVSLFLLEGKENLFKANKIMFPILSHA